MSQMVTTCANCRQQLAVTAADLRVGQGYVRCGRCDKVFNALLTLAEDAPAPTEPESVAHGTRSVPALEEKDTLPPLPGRDEAIPFGSMEESDEDEVEVVQTHVTGQFRSIVLEGEPEQVAGTDAERDQVARDILRQATSQPIDVLLEESQSEPGLAPAARPVRAEPQPEPEPVEFDAEEAVGNRRRGTGVWHALAVLLLVALAAQVLHHNRHTLVTKSWLEQPLQAFYGLFGETVEPAWDLAQYEVQQLGASQSPGNGGTLMLQAAVAVSRNAPWAYPPPILRVVLSDRWGNVLQTTDVAPHEWLLGTAPARLQPGQRVDARLSLPASERASGFALAACLPDEAGGLRCRDGAQ